MVVHCCGLRDKRAQFICNWRVSFQEHSAYYDRIESYCNTIAVGACLFHANWDNQEFI